MPDLPAALQQLVDLFAASPKDIKVQALVDYSNRLADPPPEFQNAEAMTQVHECQTPFFVAVELDDVERVTLHFQVPRESPTIRGYAGILADGLNGAAASEVIAVPPTFYLGMGIEEVVTPLRMRGMGAILHRVQSLVREQLAEARS
jgi:cysteine desulfuration protein SufE